MEWMDRARRIGGLIWVAVGIAFQVGGAVAGFALPGPITLVLVAAVLVLAGVTLAGARPAVWWAVGRLAGVLLGLDLLGAVADRFGAFGPPGGSGVSWGSWDAFVDYTARLLPGGLPRPLVTGASVLATVVEVVLGVLLVAGVQRRWVGKGAAGLLTVYLLAMAPTVGLEAVATYAVPLLIGGALLVSAAPDRPSRGASSARAGGADVGDERGRGVQRRAERVRTGADRAEQIEGPRGEPRRRPR